MKAGLSRHFGLKRLSYEPWPGSISVNMAEEVQRKMKQVPNEYLVL